jgi:hypothetical protein
VRTVLAQLLAGLLTICPILCGAEEFGRGAHLHNRTDPSSAPGHCAAEGDNCICQGAVASDAVREPVSEAFMPSLLAALSYTLPHSSGTLALNGSATSPARWGGVRAVCSLLQNFRC